MRKLLFVSFFLVIAAGCGHPADHLSASGQGMIIYNVSYPDTTNYGLKQAFFPKTITLFFKDEKAVFIATGGLGMVKIVNLLDHKKRTYTSLLIDALRQNYGCTRTEDEINENENAAKCSYELTDETAVIAGIPCKSAMVKDATNNRSFKIFYDDTKNFCYHDSPLKEFNHLLMDYTYTANGLAMKLTATRVNYNTAVDTTLFNIKGDYKWVNQKDFYAHLNDM